jgi:hypothetical protein
MYGESAMNFLDFNVQVTEYRKISQDKFTLLKIYFYKQFYKVSASQTFPT